MMHQFFKAERNHRSNLEEAHLACISLSSLLVSKIKPLLLFNYPLGPSIEMVVKYSWLWKCGCPQLFMGMCVCSRTLRYSWLQICACVPLA